MKTRAAKSARIGCIALCAIAITGCSGDDATSHSGTGGKGGHSGSGGTGAVNGGGTSAGGAGTGGTGMGGTNTGGVDAGPPPPLAPHVVRFELVTSSPEIAEQPSGAPGNWWGGHQSRIARLSTGELYATYLASPPSGNDPSQAEWVLMRRGASDSDGWAEIGRQHCGREPMHLLRRSDDSLEIISWPGTPATWTVSTAPSPTITGPNAIPGTWETLSGGSTPYSGAGISGDGFACLFASRGVAGTKPGSTYTADSAWDFACQHPDGKWGPMTTLPIGLRFCYPFVLVRDGGARELVATRDILWEAAGYTPPAGSFGYVFNAVDRWRFDSADAKSEAARNELGKLEPTSGPKVVSYTVGDAMFDHQGRLHVLTRSHSSDDVWTMKSLLVDDSGVIGSSDFSVGGYTDGNIRVVQDEFGRFVLLLTQSLNAYAVPSTDSDASQFGSPVDLTASFIADGRTIYGSPYVATPRGGTPDSRDVDLLVDMSDGAGGFAVYYARIALY